jgi:hypothetical protein
VEPLCSPGRSEAPVTYRVIVLCALALAAISCAVTAPNPDSATSTLLVMNETCSPGPCKTFEVRGWESVFVVPGQPPAGFLHIGDVSSSSACLQFPASVLFTSTEVDHNGNPLHTDSLYWTPQESAGLSALEPGAFNPFAFADSEIVPANSPGWRVTFPSGEIVASAPCRP